MSVEVSVALMRMKEDGKSEKHQKIIASQSISNQISAVLV